MESTLNAPVTPHYTFKVGDMAVHPSHGVGEVERMEDRDFGGKKTACYVIKIRDTGLKVMIPTEAVQRVGLVASRVEAEQGRLHEPSASLT